MAKQKYGNHGQKRNPIAMHIKQTQNIEKKLQEATMDGVRYGLIAMEVFDHAYALTFGKPGTLTEEQSERYTRLVRAFSKHITESYVPMKDVPEYLVTLFNEELEKIDDGYTKITSAEWLKDLIVNNSPRLGAYF